MGNLNIFSHIKFPALLNNGIPQSQTAADITSLLNFSEPSITPPLLYPLYAFPISAGTSINTVPVRALGSFKWVIVFAKFEYCIGLLIDKISPY